MSRAELVTIDFMGLDKRKDDAKEKSFHDLSWIKPEMMQQVLSLRNLSEDENIKKMEAAQETLKGLFPHCSTHTHNAPAPAPAPAPRHSSIPNCRSTSANCSGKESTGQLTIFYNGTMKVYDVSEEKAKSILMLAGEESCKQLSKDNSSRSTSPLITSNKEADQKFTPVMEQGQIQKLRTYLPMARKQSLQRFLQKRKDRMIMAAPYSQESEEGNVGFPRLSALK